MSKSWLRLQLFAGAFITSRGWTRRYHQRLILLLAVEIQRTFGLTESFECQHCRQDAGFELGYNGRETDRKRALAHIRPEVAFPEATLR